MCIRSTGFTEVHEHIFLILFLILLYRFNCRQISVDSEIPDLVLENAMYNPRYTVKYMYCSVRFFNNMHFFRHFAFLQKVAESGVIPNSGLCSIPSLFKSQGIQVKPGFMTLLLKYYNKRKKTHAHTSVGL